MAFFNRTTGRSASSPQEAIVAAAVTALNREGKLDDAERRVLAAFRSQIPSLSALDDNTFGQFMQHVIEQFNKKRMTADVRTFAQTVVAPALVSTADKKAAYRYVYSLAMADLTLDEQEMEFLEALQDAFDLPAADYQRIEQESQEEFRVVHQALAATVLGLMVVTADGKADKRELDNVRSARGLLEPIGSLTGEQFDLIYDMSLHIHDRFLTDPQNRAAFITHIVADMLDTKLLRTQAFHYAASVATSDGDIAQSEISVLQQLLEELHLSEAEGQAIYNTYMARVKTIDGKKV